MRKGRPDSCVPANGLSAHRNARDLVQYEKDDCPVEHISAAFEMHRRLIKARVIPAPNSAPKKSGLGTYVMTPYPKDLKSLAGLRAVAALLVVLFHFTDGGRAIHNYFGINFLIDAGYLGVDIFFVLSGFIIYHVYREQFEERLSKRAWADFLRNRLARIYPVHMVTLGLMPDPYPHFALTANMLI